MTPSSATLVPIDAAEWARDVAGFLDWNYRQAWAYEEASARRHGASCERLSIRLGEDLIGLCSVRIRTAPLGIGGAAYVGGGPLVRRGCDRDGEHLRLALEALRRRFVGDRGLLLRVHPPPGDEVWNERVAATFQRCGFELARAGRYRTLVLRLDRPLDEIRASLRQKWRNGLNAAERSGLDIEVGDGDELFGRFADSFEAFRSKKGFEVELGPDFHAAVQRRHLEAERYVVLLASRGGELHAGFVGSFLGDTGVYLLGLTREPGLRSKAAYALQWEAIREARRRGMRRYDLGGIDPVGNPGVYRFKRGLSGREVLGPGPFEAAGRAAGLVRRLEAAYRTWGRVVRRPRRAGSG